jgi:hypothetical protein
VKCKVVFGGLAVIGILALSALPVHAGSGGVPTSLQGFFVCHAIAGADPGREFDVESAIFGPLDATATPILQRLKVGAAALACAWARVFPPGFPPGVPRPDADACGANPLLDGCPLQPVEAQQMTCYPLSGPNKNKVSPPPPYNVFGDPLDGNLDPAHVSVPTRPQYLCAPAGYFVPTE